MHMRAWRSLSTLPSAVCATQPEELVHARCLRVPWRCGSCVRILLFSAVLSAQLVSPCCCMHAGVMEADDKAEEWHGLANYPSPEIAVRLACVL